MPISFVNYAGLEPVGNPFLRNFVENLAKGYQAGQLPAQMQRQKEQEELVNAFKRLQLQEEPERFKADMLSKSLGNQLAQKNLQFADPLNQAKLQLLKAKMEAAQRGPEPQLSNFEKAAQGAERIKQQFGEGSEQYKLARDYLSRLAQGSGTSLSVDPTTGAVTFSQGSRGGQSASQIITDEQGNKYLVNKPTTPTLTATQQGTLANFVRQDMAKNFNNPYIGSGSNIDIAKERAQYSFEKDPKKKKEIGDKLVNAAVAFKLVPEYAALQLLAQGTKPSVDARRHQEKVLTLGWPRSLEKVADNLPIELAQQADKKHNDIISHLNTEREKFISSGMPTKIGEQNTSKPDLSETANFFNTTPEKVSKALKAGIKTRSQFRQWLKDNP